MWDINLEEKDFPPRPLRGEGENYAAGWDFFFSIIGHLPYPQPGK
jgi:hypothetical protein